MCPNVNEVLPLGIGITDTPAADVQGISVKPANQNIDLKASDSKEDLEDLKSRISSEIKNI